MQGPIGQREGAVGAFFPQQLRDVFFHSIGDLRGLAARGDQPAALGKLRHTFGSLMLAADPNALIPTRDLMGHESVETTNKYAHTREEARRLALISMHELRNRTS